nr:probable pre-mRNA-splicing factor ATP-dependent RNA helicase DEAH4 [Tanacetum cinerariifolium]
SGCLVNGYRFHTQSREINRKGQNSGIVISLALLLLRKLQLQLKLLLIITEEHDLVRQYNPSTGMYSIDVVEISMVQANQRAGRAGRTRPGKCYRLYPLAMYHDNLLEATVPEIQRSSLAGSVLYLK